MEKLNFVKGISYKDFTVESSEYSEASKSTIIRLKHKSGLTVVHFANKCQDNMVFFGFRTADKTACGTPHIMEHSVLCGSEKYKVKDPFISMANQSVNTFLNAFTYPDFTGYPVSSTNKKDFFNLASVYADAVFFPMLDEGAFMQEGKGQIYGSGFILVIRLLRYLRQLCHFLHAVAQNLPHAPNTQGNVHQLCRSIGIRHRNSPSYKTKIVSSQ